MALLFLKDIELAYGTQTLLNKVQFQIEPNERVCIVGRNGEGKSTLLKVIEGTLLPDDGTRIVQDGVKIAKLQQEVPHDLTGSVFDVVAQGLGHLGELLKRFHQLTQELSHDPSDSALSELNDVQVRLDAENGWDLNQRVETTLSKLSLPADREFSALSGGMKRRVLLAQALVQAPDVLLLDEPTNHLDIPAIDWLEQFLKNLSCSLIFITHDRMFLQSLATRIVELDRGNLLNWECDYATYLERRQAYLESEAKNRSEFDKKLAQEEAWIRQGIKARRTRNEGRVRALERMRNEFSERRHLQGSAQLSANQAEASGKQVIKVTDLSFSWPDQTVVNGFSTLIQRGDKVGIIGPNGCGKSTLLKLLLGQLAPQFGTVQLGTQLKIAYFDQHRAQLDEDKPVIESVVEESDHVEINGQRKHVMGYLQDFLFSPERARQPVKALSGGERNRLLLARVFAKPANLLVLDEPTNDLDIETLELLEELLLNITATVMIVSHDRAFLNSVTTSCLAFDAPGELNHYVGGYDDWVRQSPYAGEFKTNANIPGTPKSQTPVTQTEKTVTSKPANAGRKKTQKLSYKEQREYDSLPEQIESLETQLESMTEEISHPDFYQRDDFQAVLDQMKACEQSLEDCFERWEILEAKLQETDG